MKLPENTLIAREKLTKYLLVLKKRASFIKAGSSLHFFPARASGISYLTQRHKGHKGAEKNSP